MIHKWKYGSFWLVFGLLTICLVNVGSLWGQTTAIVGATLIDGNGGPPLDDVVLVIEDGKIAKLGKRTEVSIPQRANIINAAGKTITPGFIDTNVHLSLYGGHTKARYESLVRYRDRQDDIVLEAAQLQLKYGVTTVRDSYGVLPPLIRVREAIAEGKEIGPRMMVAGNIVGWGGPFSITFSLIPAAELTLFQEQMNDLISQGVGEELMEMTPDEVRQAINAYLDKGPDFIKYGGTGHFSQPVLIGFSPDVQRAIVEETHKRGLVAETHATSIEGLKLAILAGIDLIQHPEVLGTREITDELVTLIKDRNIVCSILVNTMTGDIWQKHLKNKEETEAKKDDQEPPRTGHQGEAKERAHTSAEINRNRFDSEAVLEILRRNAERLVAAGCLVTIGTDNYRSAAPQLARGPKPNNQDHGIGTIIGIEGLVELGMSPSEAIVAATKNGAIACRGLDRFGTLEFGKVADLLILDENPLDDIGNIRKLHLVLKNGVVVDIDGLPKNPVYYRAADSDQQ